MKYKTFTENLSAASKYDSYICIQVSFKSKS